ncbi:MAG: Ig-like domain-containing protein, partial [Myxococcota bacterium]
SGRLAVVGRSRTGSAPEFGTPVDLVTGTVGANVTLTGVVFSRLTAFDFVSERRAVYADSCNSAVGVMDFDTGLTIDGQSLGENIFANADVAAVPNSELIFVPLPGPQQIAVLSFDGAALNELERLDWDAIPGGGIRPMSVASSPDGRFVLVANVDSNTVSVIELNGPESYSVRPTPISVPSAPYVVRFAEGNDLAAVALDGGPETGDDSLALIRASIEPELLGTVPNLTFTPFFSTTNGCTASVASRQKNSVSMLDISFDGARVFLAPGGPGAASEYSEIRIPQEFPALSAVVSQVAAPTSAESIAVQPGGTADSTAPILSAVRLDDGDGLLAVGAGDRISFIYSEPISNGELSSSLNANGSLTALVAQLGAFDTLGDLSASSAVLTVSDRTITITLGGSVSGSLTPGGQFTPLANSVDDSAGNRLVETTPVTVTGSFTGPFDPIYVASQGSDNSTIVVTFNVPMVDNVASRNPDNYRVSFDPGLELTVDTVTVVSGTRFEVTLNSPLFVGTRYTVSVQGSVIDQTNGLPANSERSVTSFIATDFDAPVFAGITSAVDAASVGPADGAVLLSWGAASDNDTPSESMTYRIFVSTEANDPFSLAFVDTVVGATNATVSGLISGQSYRFGVRAEDTAGNLESNTITVLASPSDGLPPTWDTSPGVLSVRNTFAGGTLAITYGRASDVSSNPTLGSLVRYNVYASSGIGSLYDSVYATIDELSEFEISGLTDGVPHFVAVRAVDAAGNEEQNTVTLTETPTFDVSPPTFSGISTAQDAGTDGRTVTVSWTEAVESNSPPIRYRLYFTAADPSADLPGLLFNEGAAPGLEPAAVVDNISGTSFNVGGLEPDTPYWFGVRARDGAFNFDTNTEFRVATPSFDTTPPLFSGVMNAQATGTLAQVRLTWDSAVEEKSPPVSFQMFYSDAEATLFD